MAGRVVLLHGASSSGKTTLIRAIQRLADDPWIHLGIDTFWNAVDERWMESGSKAADGFKWTEGVGMVPGPAGLRLAAGMRAAVAAIARADNGVLVDDVFIEPAWLDDWRRVLAGLEWLLVGVFAPLDVLEERERARGNRIAGEARAQFDVIHRDIAYDVAIDTSRLSPEEAAAVVLAAIAG
jgi:chloramphenicol 3-O phosphotransferase